MSQKAKALLVSMPWADFQFPSSQIGCLSAYARQNGFDVDGRNLFLEAATLFGLSDYDKIVYARPRLGELFFAALLFPEKEKQILKYLKRHISSPENKLKRLSDCVATIYQKIDWRKYNLIGFTVCYEQLFASLLFSKWLKRDFSNIKILFGGIHVAGNRGVSVLHCFPDVDWCVDGEGETAFVNLLRCLENSEGNIGCNVPGLIYRTKTDANVCPREQLHSLNGLPDPDYDDYFRLLESHPLVRDTNIMPFLTVESSRGCPYHCSFCTTNAYWRGYRTRNPQEVGEQIERLCQKYHINRFQFNDSSISTRQSRELFTYVRQRNRDYQFSCEIRPDADKSLLAAMKYAGVGTVQFGIEALSTKLLSKMNKGTRVIDNMKVMKFCEELGIKHISNLMIDFPTETQNDVDETVYNIEYAKAFRPPIQIVKFTLYDNITVYKDPKKYGIFNIRNSKPFNYLLPHSIAHNLSIIDKEFDSRSEPNNYKALLDGF